LQDFYYSSDLPKSKQTTFDRNLLKTNKHAPPMKYGRKTIKIITGFVAGKAIRNAKIKESSPKINTITASVRKTIAAIF
jgi:hypothetical protein